MTCSRCGYAMASADRSCPRCSAKVTSGGGVSYTSPNSKGIPSPYSSPSNQSKNNSAIVGWVVAGVLGIALAGFIFRSNFMIVSQVPVSEPVTISSSINQPVSEPISSAPQAPVAAVAPIAAVPPVAAPPLQPQIRIGPSFNEVDAKMDDRRTDLTDAQKQAYWASISGSQVTWTGEVIEVEITSGGQVRLKCNPQTWGSDVTVQLDGTQVKQLHVINKSQQITIRGILQDHSMFGYDISQAQIVGI